MIAAILKAQWLSLRRWRTGTGRLGGALAVLAGCVWYGLWTALGAAAYRFAAEAGNREAVAALLPRGLMLVILYWQLAPVLTAGMGASLDLRKLLVYPAPHGRLFYIEVLLRLSTAGEMLLVLAGATAGLMRNPALGSGTADAARAAMFALLAAFNLFLAAGVRSLLERLLSRRLIREALALALVLLAVLPQFLIATGAPPETLRRFLTAAPHRAWPWSAAARAGLGTAEAGDWLLLAGYVAAAWLFGRRQFERSLRFDAEAAQAARPAPAGEREPVWQRLYRIPSLLLADPLGALVEKEMRSLSRTSRFRTVFIMGFSFGLIVWLPLAWKQGGEESLAGSNFLTLVSLYALTLLGQVSYWNSFGFDRGAVQNYFVWPVRMRSVLAAKNLAAAGFILAEIALVTAACQVAGIPTPGKKVAEAFVVTGIAGLYLLASGNYSSIRFPRAMSPERVTQGGGGGRFQTLLFLVYPAAMLPVLLAYAAGYAFDSDRAFYAVLAFAGVLGAVIYWLAMDSACQAAESRREAFLAELARGEGPVAPG